jgi:hypothetical protein
MFIEIGREFSQLREEQNTIRVESKEFGIIPLLTELSHSNCDAAKFL